MTEKQFLEIYPQEIILIAVPYHGGARNYYIPDKGVAIVRFNQRGKIRKITMRKVRPYELEIATELMKRRKAEQIID